MGWGTLAPDREARLEAQIRRCGFKSRRGYEERRPSSPARWRQCEQLSLEPSVAPPRTSRRGPTPVFGQVHASWIIKELGTASAEPFGSESAAKVHRRNQRTMPP